MNGVAGFRRKLSCSGWQRDKADRHGEEAADVLVTVTRQPVSSVGGSGVPPTQGSSLKGEHPGGAAALGEGQLRERS